MGLGSYAVVKPHKLLMNNCESHRCAQYPARYLTACTYRRSYKPSLRLLPTSKYFKRDRENMLITRMKTSILSTPAASLGTNASFDNFKLIHASASCDTGLVVSYSMQGASLHPTLTVLAWLT